MCNQFLSTDEDEGLVSTNNGVLIDCVGVLVYEDFVM